MAKEFRKLPIDLPRQPLVNQRPWAIAGLFLVLVLLLLTAYQYWQYKQGPSSLIKGKIIK